MPYVLLVALGGAIGAVGRYLLNIQLTRLLGHGWPYGTLAANLLGGFLMGMLVGVLAHRLGGDNERWRVLLGVGVLGGFTTFSAYSLELGLMIEKRAYAAAAGYASLSVAGSVAALFLGVAVARRIFA